MLAIGSPAPDFSGKDQNGSEITLKNLLQKGPVVLYFYPGDFTPICTEQACSFRDAYEDLRENGAEIVGVSKDSSESHVKFARAYNVPFPLLADPEKKLVRDYGVARAFGLFTGRITYVIGQDGKIAAAYSNTFNGGAHVDAVRDVLKRLSPKADPK